MTDPSLHTNPDRILHKNMNKINYFIDLDGDLKLKGIENFF